MWIREDSADPPVDLLYYKNNPGVRGAATHSTPFGIIPLKIKAPLLTPQYNLLVLSEFSVYLTNPSSVMTALVWLYSFSRYLMNSLLRRKLPSQNCFSSTDFHSSLATTLAKVPSQ